MRIRALEEAQSRARKKAAVERWAEAEANRLIAEGAREREASREAERHADRLEADRPREESIKTIPTKNASPAAAVTTAGRAVLPQTPPAQPPRKRPPANVSLDEVRKKVTAQIRKALPAIAAAQANRENGDRSR
jgi:hypothetical protein